ncbi:MAG: hypothetical protein DMF98_02125 [Acidobacteria bacterium]|nr:MAG: hypothetical protein DMF98_02125 [Acidobacteriota bacterium]
MSTRLLATLLCIVAAWGCNDSSPNNPAAVTQATLTGRWTGDLIVQGVTGRMTWTLSQTGTSVTGPVTIGLPNGVVLLNGTLSGTLTGTSLDYTIAVAASGVPDQPACTGQLGGTMTVTTGTVSTMIGPIAVRSTNCSIQFPTSSFTLTKQSGIGS